VEIITTPSAQPNMAWLNFVVTGKARSSIRHFLKNQQRHESVELGRRLLNQFLGNYGTSLDEVDSDRLALLLQEAELRVLDDLLEDIGMGNRMAYVVARRLKPEAPVEDDELAAVRRGNKPLAIQGTEGMVLHYAKCCHPIPGDTIIAHISTGRGLVIHRTDCRNIGYLRDDPEKSIYFEWSKSIDDEFRVSLKLEVVSQRGIIANLATTVATAGANIIKIDSGEKDGQLSQVQLDISVQNRVHLASVMKKLRVLKAVHHIQRQ
jgi:(p)ppGpp synthase/HD superfamily hydrolase